MRIRWHEDVEQRPIVYLDESGFAMDAPRTHGYSGRGTRCYGQRDWHEKGRLNAIGAIVAFELIAVALWECNIDSDVFLAWVQKALLPSAPPTSVVVMDNATFHKRADIIRVIEKQGHTVEFLPSYSPDLNPIEKKWAQAKAQRRQRRCTPMELFSAASGYSEL
jgi:transposase